MHASDGGTRRFYFGLIMRRTLSGRRQVEYITQFTTALEQRQGALFLTDYARDALTKRAEDSLVTMPKVKSANLHLGGGLWLDNPHIEGRPVPSSGTLKKGYYPN
ncbi:unnamed protein product, partial [Brenthis ino]